MYEDLINKLRELPHLLFVQLGEHKDVVYQAADAIEELSRDLDCMNDANIALYGALPKWIPVTERLPDEYVSVLCYCSRNGQYGCGERCKEDNGTIYWIGLNGMIPTHWMPLPDPPKDGEA